MRFIEHTENIVVRLPYSAVLALLSNVNPSLAQFRLESVDIDEQNEERTVTFFLSRDVAP